MNITIQRADLARTLAAVCKVVEHRQTIPILANVLLQASDDRLTVIGTDLDIEYSATTPCSGEQGSTTVDAKRLSDIARRLSGDTVSLALKDDSLVVKSGRSRFTLPTLPVEDYPRLDGGTFDVEFNLDFAALVAPVKFAVSTEQTRYYLCGVHLHSTAEGGIRAVATDGHRLAHNTASGVPAIPAVIVPAKTVGIAPAGELDVSLSTNKIRFANADTVIVSKLIDGTFPDYGRVIPQGNDRILTVDRKELSNAIGRVASVATERGKAAKLSVAGDNVAIDMRSDDGTAHEDVPGTYSAEPIEIGFNSQYLGDVLGSLDGEEITIALGDPGSPALFSGAGEGRVVLMPMRV
jgi:DNA polymerase-3 subunit beta